MYSTLFQHPSSEDLPFQVHASLAQEDSAAKFIIPPLNLQQILTPLLPQRHLSGSLYPNEISLKKASGIHQSKATGDSCTSKVGTTEGERQVLQREHIQVFYSDQSENQFRHQNSCHREERGFDFDDIQVGVEDGGQNAWESCQRVFQNSSGAKSKSKREKSSESSQTPKIPTRNILQYFWKVFKNYFLGKRKPLNDNKGKADQMKKLWQQVGTLKPSLPSFSKLFKNQKMRPFFIELFRQRFLMREIMGSSLRSSTKITYLRYVKILLKGFLTGELLFLN